MKEQEIKLEGKRFFYRSYGQGPVVMLIHGFGEDGSLWKEQFHAFNGFQLLIPDLPGSGRSEMTTDMSMEGLATTLLQFLEQLQVKKCTLIGHSMGGYVTLAFAEKYPGHLNAIGLFHSTAYPDTEEKKEMRKKSIDFIRQHGAYEYMKTSTPNLFSPLTKKESPLLIEQQVVSSRSAITEALIRYSQAMIARPDRTGVLKGSRVPVLFALGRHDQAVSLKDGLEQCHLPDCSYVELFERSGHMGMQEENRKANEFLVKFLRETTHNPLPDQATDLSS